MIALKYPVVILIILSLRFFVKDEAVFIVFGWRLELNRMRLCNAGVVPVNP